ncbi:MAG TPA: TAXI family TRAP transporter solute-binding subunit [Burkholderiaceae bacterium]|nr:TAXI family TRAP transporter solute-binding subunit [Burkholderiaceae bacterium]
MTCWRRLGSWVIAALAVFAASPGVAQVPYKIVTASERGTYIQIGRDLARFVAPDAGIDLDVLPSAGSAENVRRLRHEPGVKFAMVQSDVYQAFLDQDRGGNAEAGVLIRPLRVIMPLYNEEIYFIARADSELEFVHQIKDAKINVGPLLSGTAMSATTLYRQMFDAPMAEANTSYLTNEDALVKLTVDKTLDVVVVVAGQPAKLLVDMKPAARQLIKLLKFDASRPESQAALKTYFAATVRATSYPSLLTEDLPAVAVKAYLVTYDYALGSTVSSLRKFARSLCQNFGTLQSTGHPKWREVDLTLPALGRGWIYYPPMARELQSCSAGKQAAVPSRGCTQQERILGLCK